MVIYGIKTCDTCRKAVKALDGAELRDIRVDPLSPQERAEFIGTFGAALINRSSATWRALSEEDRALPEAELLERHPTVMKRPVIRSGDALHLGWSKDVQAALLP
ncbi:arsenate reductase [Falsirhodobacter algicola]|uniref:Arsenate reductase n=1 Tax=Falsirhodobacter algicola TaxID=2692330 RepID=A0A8J8MUF8_9RHOB|nr:arsenate reductase [Falsirhodobacter algicola]